MEEALQPLASPKSENIFPVGIAVSLGLHLVLSALILGTPANVPTAPTVSYIDLSAVHQPSEIAAPAKVPTPPPPAPAPELKAPSSEPAAEKVLEEPATAAPVNAPEAPSAPNAAAVQAAPEMPNTSMGLGMVRGYFSSLGNGETLRESIREYYLEMLQRINERWWLDQTVDQRGARAVLVSITILRSGEIVNTRILQSSGNKAYDKAVLQALTAGGGFPPLPEKYVGDAFTAPIRLVPPLNLMSWKP